MKKSGIYFKIILAVVLSFALSACGNKETVSVEDEVTKALIEKEPIPDGQAAAPGSDENPGTSEDSQNNKQNDPSGKTQNSTETGSGTASGTSSVSSDKPGTGSGQTGTAFKSPSADESINYFLGEDSTATSFNIKFKVQTDSGFAGIAWGGTKPHAGIFTTDEKDSKSKDFFNDEFYVVSFDCTREFPRLYTCRIKDGEVFDEVYTNIDFMYPEMSMFTGGEHIVEIKVDAMTATTYLDSYKIADTSLPSLKPCGLIGTCVMPGNYHEYIDDLFVAEGVEGDGEWIYSDDFSRKTNLFTPNLFTNRGRLYAKNGYYTVSPKPASK